ncbi:hypothetical protein LHFGNBLO_005623 [Mesorhizobium sp. AR10]|uniref:WD40/YVTN/BNR-like repeat-containing protein n=1 Tax=Mesorhizobium sp. AR10 TaxID=2865839 RepID=UPI00215F3952|nr:hypothetical protein [Mesorhizobium sp. AR10]UVK38457.1 hypothetical protein LHFGNBLO_005623 [Mesorhizobium sp. AR10]
MTDDTERYISPEGFTVDCTLVQADKGTGVWNLIVQMDEGREEKRSQIFHTPSAADVEPVILLDTHTWISSFWVAPSRTIYACDGFSLWRGSNNQFTQQRLSDRMIFKVWGLDEATVFVLGEEGLVLRSRGEAWEQISIPDTVRLSNIHGLSSKEIFAVGERGAFWQLTGDIWTQIDINTNANLLGVYVDGPGRVYVCGENGICFRYESGSIVTFVTQPRRYTSVVRFRDNIYFGASGQGVDILQGQEVIPFKPNVFGQRLSAGDNLWSCGHNAFFRFDGNGWYRKSFK